jgi:predicted nucleic acid-binding protein
VLVVADSSPLIYLSRIGLLHILPTLFGDVVVPRAVWEEALGRRPSAPGIESLRQASWIRVVDDPSPSADLGLDAGETAAILVAESLRANLLLIDERLGRAVAQARGLAVRGTLGVLVQARRSNILSALAPVLDALVAEGFRIAPALLRQALVFVGEGTETEGSGEKTDGDRSN